MNEYLEYLGKWKSSKSAILSIEGYEASVTGTLGHEKKARFIDLDTDKVISRATLWESGELELEALDIDTEKRVIQKSTVVQSVSELDDELNWWMSEVTTC
ncbi:immunity protein TriTu family protein [Vibrio marisflavi]|uniref:Lipocalin-like domain-containing protein n=1 Tax=Vibrio marisflavi CECT 7928 TaxID=634439 RepID=A0ABM9A6H0_9VIBR|nr:hypothetical protein [Vibrio marisflavi]CAH0540923.1 hypothetical protein VMF7928_03236 [Vibrio marisflavi CECT 7928]